MEKKNSGYTKEKMKVKKKKLTSKNINCHIKKKCFVQKKKVVSKKK
jgi:hypothetical protein